MSKSNIRDQIYFYLFLALAFFIPVHDRLVAPLIALIGLNWILEFNFREKFLRLKQVRFNRQLLSFSLLYIMYGVGVLYSENLTGRYVGAFSNLEEKMSLWVFPLLLSTIPFDSLKKNLFTLIQKAFILGCLFISIYLIGNATYTYVLDGSVQEFYYTGLSEFHHAGYLAMFISLAIAFLLNSLLFKEKPALWSRSIRWILILFFQLMIVLLSSKAGVLGLILIYLVSFIWILMKTPKPFIRFWLPLLFLVLFFITLFSFPKSFHRFYSLEKTMEQQPVELSDQNESTVARMLIWESSLELISENPLWGVGTGDVKDELMVKYKEKGIIAAFEQKLNSHNQFLQTYIGIGLFGFLLLLGSLVIPAWLAFRKKQLLYFLFLLLIVLHMLVESILEKQAGVVFYAFFNVVLFYFSFMKEK